MEHLIKNLIENLINKRNQEIKNIETYAKNDVKDFVLITTGKVIEMDKIIKDLNEMLNYNMHLKTDK